MSGIQEQIGGTAPPDEWLALSEAERAEVRRRAAEFASDEMQTAPWVELPETAQPLPEEDAASSEPVPPPSFEDAVQSAELLELEDRIRLTSRLLMSLPLKNRAAIVTLGLKSLEESANEALHQATQSVESFWSILWRALFDPANTSDLYSAPHRFDLATIFVVTAAYSLLFGALTAFEAVFHFGPLPLIILGLVLAVVGITQAFCHGMANPRGVSVVAGGGAFALLYLLALVFHPQLFAGWFAIEIVIGLFLAPVWGYIAGVLVGGVFLVADKLRNRMESTRVTTAEDRKIQEGGDP